MLIPLHPLGCDDAHILVTDGTGSIDFHLCGTRRVNAQPERSSVCETVALRPRSPYGRSKLFVERPLLELDPPDGMTCATRSERSVPATRPLTAAT
jgi:UDP-glucose 4-epimerase